MMTLSYDKKSGCSKIGEHRFQLVEMSHGSTVRCRMCDSPVSGPNTGYVYKSPRHDEDDDAMPPFYCHNCVGRKAELVKEHVASTAWFNNR